MRRMRWAMDGGGRWDLDVESPVTMEGTARPVPGAPLPLGLSRGPRLTRTKQLDFMHRFMASPLVPSFAGDNSNGGSGLLLHHAHLLHFRENWSVSILEQFHVQNLLSFVKENASNFLKDSSWIKTLGRQAFDILSLGFGTEFFITPDSSVIVETYNVKKGNRSKAIFNHKFPQHNLMLEAAWPGLFADERGMYWDVPLLMAVDFASVASGSGLSYHFSLQHNSGKPKNFGEDQTSEIPVSLLPGLSAKAAISIKKNTDIWRRYDGKLKMVQPYDVFLSDPHVSVTSLVGAVASASLGDNSARLSMKDEFQRGKALNLCVQKNSLGLFADLFATVSCTAQHGNFQRLFLDLTRLNARLDLPSGSRFLNGAASLAQDFYKSCQLDPEAFCAICPDLMLSFQQQIIGPISFRVDSKVAFDPKDRKNFARVDESVLALDWALQVLGSARATAWYSPKRREAMVELRFFES